MKKLLMCLTSCIITGSLSQVVEADSNETVSVSYLSESVDYTQGASKSSGDLSGYSIEGTIPVGEKFYVGLGYASMDGTILGVNAAIDQTYLGFGMNLMDDLDLSKGKGSRLRLGIAKVSTEFTVSLGGSSATDKGKANFITGGYEMATGDKTSFTFGISGPTKDFNPTFSLGGRYEVGAGSISAGFSSSEDLVNGVTVETSGFNLGYSFSY